MENYTKKIEIRWADLDPNFHVIHSKYYDFGAYCRMAFLVEHGFSPVVMAEYHIGPILFREECVFKREILFGDDVEINVKLQKMSSDYGRWTMVHEIYKNKETLCAILTADIAWMDTIKRKLTTPPEFTFKLVDLLPKTSGFNIYNR
jgi:acyl-CoA thioester hydrolase